MLLCINCGRSFENAKYCMFCGTLLRQKIVNYETSGTLLRSNLNPESVNPILSPTKNMAVQEDQKKTAFCASAADSVGSVGGAVIDLSIKPVSEQPEETDDKPIEEDISFDDFVTRMDESTVSDETESLDSQVMSHSDEQNRIAEPEKIEVAEVEVETAEPIFEQPEETDDKPIEEDISFDDFVTRMDESTVSNETESLDSQIMSHSDEENGIAEPEKIEVAEIEVETAEPVSEQPEETDDKPIEEDISFDDFVTRMDESTVSNETLPSDRQEASLADEESKKLGSKEIAVNKVDVESDTAEMIPDQTEIVTDVHNSAVSLTPQSSDYSDIDPMFGEPPRVNYTVFNPESSAQSAKPMSWIERLKRKNNRK